MTIPAALQTRITALHAAMKQRILILDGGMGTMIQSYKLQEADYRGARFADYHMDIAGNNDLLGHCFRFFLAGTTGRRRIGSS